MKIFIIFSILHIISFNAYCQYDQQNIETQVIKSKPLIVGEDLTYVVKYAFLNLGEVRFKVVEKTNVNDISVYKTMAFIDSYPDLPIVSVHQIYESYIDSSSFPQKFIARIFGEDTIQVEYIFTENSKIKMQKVKSDGTKIWFDSTTYTNQQMQDGLSILYYTRMNFGEEKTISVPCFVNEKVETTIVNFNNESEAVSIDAVDYEIDCKYLSGKTDFVSVYGLTGDFEGWFSNDSQSVPIRAKMNVIIGSINLELIKWNESIWTPPQFKN